MNQVEMSLKTASIFILAVCVVVTLVYWGQKLQDKTSPGSFLDTNRIYNLLEKISINANSSVISQHVAKVLRHDSSVQSKFTPTTRQITETTNPIQKYENIPRIGVICYIPAGNHQALHFITMLYGSWRYVADHRDEYYSESNKNKFHFIDLLAFCHPSVCPAIQQVCKKFSLSDNIADTEMNCWAIEQTFESRVPYGPINSFIMFNRTDIHQILQPYINVIRTDFDVFLTPALLTWQPHFRVVYGKGGYCDPFNMKRLKEISAKLGMRHQGIHCIGSTWYGETELFIELSKKTLEMTGYMYLNEFDPKAPGLETIPFNKNREGEWIRWWRPVSLLYGAELSINHLIDNLSQEHKGEFDTPSCSTKMFWETPHIHCWHSDCEFQKFKFMRQLNSAIQSKESLPGEIVHRIIRNIYTRPIDNMTIADYSTYIAWNSVGKYLRKWFV